MDSQCSQRFTFGLTWLKESSGSGRSLSFIPAFGLQDDLKIFWKWLWMRHWWIGWDKGKLCIEDVAGVLLGLNRINLRRQEAHDTLSFSMRWTIAKGMSLTCHLCDLGLIVNMRQVNSWFSKVGSFLRVLWFPPPTTIRKCQHMHLRERIYKFFFLLSFLWN